MTKKEIFLVIVYLIGAVVDAAVSVPMFGMAFSRQFEYEVSYSMVAGGVLMISWTVLLLWAASKPVARRDILLITLVPIAGMFISNCILGSQTTYSSGIFLLRIIGGPLLAALYIFAFIFTNPEKNASRVKGNSKEVSNGLL
jgi:hypothetical protein